ncbi:MAG: DsbA family protein, partial [Myxococcota bacterium]|nr:DsbA family protein [Myxococcota bacterium]
FEADMQDPKIQAQVNYERNLATALGVRGTPGFIINGTKSVGWGSYGGFKIQVARAVKAAQQIAAAGKTGADVAIEATKLNGDDGKKFAEIVWGIK